MRSLLYATLGLLIAFMGVAPAAGQVVREDGVKSVAGALGGLGPGSYDEFTLSSSGGEILFASLDGSIYQSQGRGAGHHESFAEPVAAAEDGCSDAGGDQFCLQVVDSSSQVLCWAERPQYPGWRRDPSLACPLPGEKGKPETYRLRVSLADHDCGDLSYPDEPGDRMIPYVLNVSLRRIAPEGALAPAIAASKNRL